MVISATLAIVILLICIGTILELIEYFRAKEKRSKASSKADLIVTESAGGIQEHSQQLRNALQVNEIETMSQEEGSPRE